MQASFRYFLVPYLILLSLAITILSITDHGDTVLWMNSIHTDFLNWFFKVWTFGGDGILFGVIAVFLLIFRRRFGYIFLLVGAVQGLVSAFMKRVLFEGTPRPRKYFEGTEALDLIAGVNIHDFNSFPSGHTMTAFAVAVFLSLMIQRGAWSVILLLSAAMVGVSRIYLNQHFLVDVIVGSFIGVLISMVLYKAFERYLNKSDKHLVHFE